MKENCIISCGNYKQLIHEVLNIYEKNFETVCKDVINAFLKTKQAIQEAIEEIIKLKKESRELNQEKFKRDYYKKKPFRKITVDKRKSIKSWYLNYYK